MSRTNYIFIDYENVQETDLDRIANKRVKVVFVLGERHKNLPLPLVKQMLKYEAQVEVVETGSTGKNALDLVLALHIGERKTADPLGYFHIVSKDKDFDALITHLNSDKPRAARRAAFSEIPVLMTLAERVKLLISRFKATQASRPKKRNALESMIQAVFGKALLPPEIEETIQALLREKAITLSEQNEVAYKV